MRVIVIHDLGGVTWEVGIRATSGQTGKSTESLIGSEDVEVNRKDCTRDPS